MSNIFDIIMLKKVISINGQTFKFKQIFIINNNAKFVKVSIGIKLLLRLSNILNFDNLLKYLFFNHGMI